MTRRFKPNDKCPVCGGCEHDPRGTGQRCAGWYSPDERIAFCMRPEMAGQLTEITEGGAFAHLVDGSAACKCGLSHTDARPALYVVATPSPGPATASYLYTDETGVILYKVERFGTGKNKFFRQSRAVAFGYEPGLGATRRVIYRLKEITDADPGRYVVIAEGEKDVDTLWNAGYIATCNPMGAGKWSDSYSPAFAGRDVVILPDNDEVGQRHAASVAKSVAAYATSVTIAVLPAPFKDVSDYLVENTGQQLAELIDAAPPWNAAPAPQKKLLTVEELRRMPAPVWLLEPDLQRDSVAFLVGESGIGKTFVALDYALRVAQKEAVIYIAGEGASGLYQRIAAWCDYYHGTSERLYIYTEAVQFINDAARVEFTEQIKPLHPALIVVDTLRRAASGYDENSAKDMSLFEAALQEVKKDTGACMFVLHHMNKSGRYSGSTALIGQPDTFLTLKRVGDLVRLTCEKQRNAQEAPSKIMGFFATAETLVVCLPADATRKPGIVSEVERRILEAALQSIFAETGISSKVLKETIDASPAAIYNSLSALKDKAYLEQSTKGDPYRITDSGRDVIGKGPAPWVVE